jgi:predicted phosphodiesterase
MIAIISDIHGNNVALSAVLEKLDGLGVDKIFCLGDICGYYAQVNECCEGLRSRKVFSLMGNHDWYIVSGQNCPRSNSANRCLDYQREVISKSNFDWLATLKPYAQIEALNMVHGGWKDPLEEYVVPSDEYFGQFPGQFFVSGHTHVPCIWSGNGKTYCNPGSVGQPRDGDPRASFAIWNQENFSLHRVEYDFNLIQTAMHNAGFEPYFYKDLAIGARIGGKIDKLQLDQ